MPSFARRWLPDPRYFAAIRFINDAIEVYRAAGHPEVAARLEAELAALEVKVVAQSEADAKAGDTIIRDTLRERLVRDTTPGPHLGDRVRSLALPAGIPGGAIGYGDLDDLEKAVDPKFPEFGTYWRAIEYGSDHMVGRIIPGYFQPGFAAPSASEFRQHPYFTPASGAGLATGDTSAPAMRVQNPIEPKHFLRDGSATAAAEHETQMQRLQSDAADAFLAATDAQRTR